MTDSSGHGAGYPSDYRPAKVRALIIAVDGQWAVAEIGTDLRTYQEIVRAPITVYEPSGDWRIYCDDASAMSHPPRGSRLNRLATELAAWADPLFRGDIFGNAVIVGVGPAGQLTGVPDSLLRRVEGDL